MNSCPPHGDIINNNEGDIVCQRCGLCLDKIYSANNNVDLKKSSVKLEKFHFIELYDICENNHISQSTRKQCEKVVRKYFQQNKVISKNQFRLLCAVSLYLVCNEDNIPRTVSEICQMYEILPKEFSQFLNKTNFRTIRNEYEDPLLLSQRYALQLDVKRKDAVKFHISSILKNFLIGKGYSSQTIAAIILYENCKLNYPTISIESICNVCSVSANNIKRLIKAMYYNL